MEALVQLQGVLLSKEQCDVRTCHLFHAGMYARELEMPAGMMSVGAVVKIPTLVIITGDVSIYGEGGPVRYKGTALLPGSAGRKAAFFAHTDSSVTMIFPTQAQTVEDAEREFTFDHEKLMSRKSVGDIVTVTGE